MFAYAAREHSKKYGTSLDDYGQIAYKNHRHSVNNPYAAIQKQIPLKKILKSRMVCEPIAITMSAPTADGAAAAVVCSREFMMSRWLQVQCVCVCVCEYERVGEETNFVIRFIIKCGGRMGISLKSLEGSY